MSWAAVVVGGATLVGGAMGSSASRDASRQQQQAADQATQLQREQYDQARADAMPWTSTGVDALNLLRQRLGLGTVAPPVDVRQQAAQQAQQQQLQGDIGRATYDSLRAELLPQFTTTTQGAYRIGTGDDPGGFAPTSTVNEAALNAEIQRRLQAAQQGQAGGQIVGEGAVTNRPLSAGTTPGVPGTGLIQGVPAAVPGAGPQTQGFVAPQDRVTQVQGPLAGVGNRLTEIMARPGGANELLQLDPGYQFRVQQGQQALERSAAARGGLLSGRALKDTADFSQGLASQEFGQAFARAGALDERDYGRALTDANRSWDQGMALDNRGYSRAWDLDQSSWNRLASLAGIGQSSQQNTSALGAQFGNSAASNTIGAGNAAAAGTVGSANAWTNALQGGVNQFNTNRLFGIWQEGLRNQSKTPPTGVAPYGTGGGTYGTYGGDPYRN